MIYLLNRHRAIAPQLRKHLTLLGWQFLAKGHVVEAWKTLLLLPGM